MIAEGEEEILAPTFYANVIPLSGMRLDLVVIYYAADINGSGILVSLKLSYPG